MKCNRMGQSHCKLSAQRDAPSAESAFSISAEDTTRTAVRRKWRIGSAR